jgi:UDP-N-acetylglucosamine--N-acetylmuramyl-(pentapeptide) pyrophosphoryl-undecaprenol N-acetylglucosamine transferase
MSTATPAAPLTVIFAGGGTGGHIFPNLAILEALKPKETTAQAVGDSASDAARLLLPPHFLLSDRAIDASIAAEHNLLYTALPAKPFGLSPRTFLRFVTHWGRSVREARAVIRMHKAKGSVVLVATGGFVSAPAIQAARAQRVQMVMVNLDAVPGRANRWAAGHATRVFTAATIPEGPGRAWEVIPPIVRTAARAPGDAAHCRHALGLDPGRPVLLITGASLGARSINQLITRLVEQSRPSFDGWQILHQTGGTDADASTCAAAYTKAGISAVVRPFVKDMGLWWGAADLALGRCGAGIVAEAWANTVPAVFMPYPYHKDQHQRANALPLQQAGAAEIVTDLIDPAANASGAGARLLALLADGALRAEMRKQCASLGPADGASRVAEAVWALAK